METGNIENIEIGQTRKKEEKASGTDTQKKEERELPSVVIQDTKIISQIFRENGMLIKPSAIEELKERNKNEILGIIEKLKQKRKIGEGEIFVVKEADIKEITQEIKIPDFAEVKRPSDFRPTAKEYGHNIKFFEDKDITGKSRCSGKLEDFVIYIKDRFQKTKNILTARPSPLRVVNIGSLSNIKGNENVRIIGIVNEKHTTKGGHASIQLEDETGVTNFLALNEKQRGGQGICFDKAEKLTNDEIIAVDIRTGENYNIALDITWPEMPVKPKKTIDKDMSIAFISDMHIGSKYFLDKEFERMLKWLNGMGEGREIAEKIGYLLIAGDMVDGIGNYPKQEFDLAVKDIYEQYRIFREMMELVPDYIKIVLIPGNHDGVRLAEPQPAIGEDMVGDADNVHSLSSPGYVEIEGFKVLMYHGVAIDAFVKNIRGLKFAHPEEVMIEMLKRRSLCPTYDSGSIAPEHKDYLFVEECDIFQTGHAHKNGYTEYRGCVAINAGTWQGPTAYQLKQGHVLSPCILPVYNLKEGRVTHLNFSGEKISIA